MGFGAVATFLGVAFLSPRLVGPIAGFVGRPFERLRGITRPLARENTVHSPGRTAVTAERPDGRVALVTFAWCSPPAPKTTIPRRGDQRLQGPGRDPEHDTSARSRRRPRPRSPRCRASREVASVRFAQGRRSLGDKRSVTGIDTRTLPDLYKSGWKQGSDLTFRTLGPGEVIVAKKFAEDKSIKVGDTLRVETAKRLVLPLKVTGIVDDKGGLLGQLTVPEDVAERDFGARKDSFAFVGYNGTRPAKAVKADIDKLLNDKFPEAESKTNQQFIKDQEGQVDQLLTLIYALLAMAIIVSLFGIVNTLVLSISERTRELGLLRAIGMSRRQVRRVIRYEAIITAQIGAVIGMALGIVLSILVTRAIDGFKLSIPIGALITLLILAAVAGVFAAILPARRASRLNVLESLAYE